MSPFPGDLRSLPPLLTRRDVAVLARCTVRTVERAQARGELRCGRPWGARALYDRRDVLRWLGVAEEAVL